MKINFSYNWNNKLNCKAYTTIRLYNPSKYRIGEKCDITLKRKFHHNGEIIDIKNFYLKDLNNFVALIDTGYSLEECRDIILKMYKNLDFTEQLLSLILIKSN